jgi:ribosome recycling factor
MVLDRAERYRKENYISEEEYSRIVASIRKLADQHIAEINDMTEKKMAELFPLDL